MLTSEYLNECFSYSPETGVLTWNKRPRSHFNTERGWKIFNSRCANKQAGYIDCVKKIEYRKIRLHGKTFRTHRVIWIIVYGKWPDTIDHINGNGLDNRLCNLRSVTQRENHKNTKVSSRNTSGVMGIHWHKKQLKWIARIAVGGKEKHLGCFSDIGIAISARLKAEKRYGYHENHGRAL